MILCSLVMAVAVTIGERSFKTYPYSDPDPVPATSEKRYPYCRWDGSSMTAETQAWKTVTLSSDRLELTFLPEIGGKLWGARDKVSGRDFIYFNHVVKFRNVAMCGPWCSGGIEFNFGIIGHSPTTAVPVDWTTRTNEDGSVSYFCGDTERICGTVWQVEVRLRDGDDFFTTRTLWSNESGLNAPYYHWMNAAFPLTDGAEFVFPGAHHVGHEGDAHPWPVDEAGRDLRVYWNNAFGENKSYHVVTGDPRYFAIWWNDRGIGVCHENDFGEMVGRKIWLWSQARSGAIWEDLLTDGDGQYAELQAGRGFNQPRFATFRTPFKHPTFSAGRVDSFCETWRVVRDKAETLSRERTPAARIERPVESPADFDWSSAYGHCVRGEQALRERDDDTAERELGLSLEKEPCYAPALVLLAELKVRRGQWSDARRLLAKALAVNAYDPAANYLDGLSAQALGDEATAHERLGLAAYSSEYRVAAYVAMGDADRALAADQRSIAALRLKGDTKTLSEIWPTYREREDVTLLGKILSAYARRDKDALNALARESVAFAFPWDRSQVLALDWARANHPSWKFRYLRGVLAAYFHDSPLADGLLDSCDDADEASVFLYRASRARGANRRELLRRAAALGDSWRVGRALALHYREQGDLAAAKDSLADYLRRFPRTNPLEILYAKTLVDMKDYRGALDFLEGVTILPSEFGDNATDAWHEAQRALGIPLSWPERLGKGKPYDEKTRKD